MNKSFYKKKQQLKRKEEALENRIKQMKTEEKPRKPKPDIAANVLHVGIVTVFVFAFAVLIWQGVELIVDVTKSAATAVHYSKLEDSVTSGVVIDKKSYTKTEGGGFSYGAIYSPAGGVTPGYSIGGNSSSRLVYELTVSFEITDKDGKEYVGEKTFEVSEGAYLSYNIGDFFDSLNYENKYLEEDA